MPIKKLLIATLAVGAAMSMVQSAHAVEKTAIDKRINTPLDVDVEALNTFLGSLIDRIKIDLGNQITRLDTDIRRFDTLTQNILTHITGLTANYNVCAHAERDVPPTTATSRLQWTGGSWAATPLQSWEHD